MNRLIVLFLLLVSCSITAQDVPAKLDSLMQAYQSVKHFNGTVLVAQKGKILLHKAYGWQDMAARKPATPNTQYQIGSVTKQFTTAIILKLQEQGKLSVTDKVSKYFPSFPRGGDITLEQLMRHTSGIYNYTKDGIFMQTGIAKSYSQEEMIARFANKPLDFEPGTKWSYSNSGYMLLGYIAAKASGKSYEQLAREIIFRPLNMRHTGFDFTNLKNNDKAIGYFAWNDSASLKAPIVDSTVSYAAGAIYSTTGDLYKWAVAVGAGKMLKASSWAAAFTPGLGNYGYGWSRDSIQGYPSMQHGGGIHGFNSNLAIIPDAGVTIILLSNINNDLLGGITNSLAAAALGKPYELPVTPKQTTISAEELLAYNGEYQLAPTFSIKVWDTDGKLMAQATGQGAFELFAEKKDHFFLKVVDARMEFLRSATGEVESLILHQSGRSMPGKKVK